MNQVEGDNKKVEGIITNTSGESYKIEFDVGFKPGDVVRLKSGSPDMVVESLQKHIGINTPDTLQCVWMNDNCEVCKNTFNPVVLEYAREEVPPPIYNPYELVVKEFDNFITEWIHLKNKILEIYPNNSDDENMIGMKILSSVQQQLHYIKDLHGLVEADHFDYNHE